MHELLSAFLLIIILSYSPVTDPGHVGVGCWYPELLLRILQDDNYLQKTIYRVYIILKLRRFRESFIENINRHGRT